MYKRAAEGDADGEPPQKQAAPDKGEVGGMKADQVANPIPRLFSQNSITIHIAQRTFEDLGPSELKWVPTSQYWAAMFDKFHWHQFKKYYDRCATFEISEPKVRISNILMLQDEQTTEAGTPKDVSVFTQACYLMHIEPSSGMRNWFRLGSTDSCMANQKMLTYTPMKETDCKNPSQLIKIGASHDQYVDFERLTINPCKPNEYAGWNFNETNVTKNATTASRVSMLPATEEIDIENTKLENVATTYYVSDTYISPNSPILGDFSCSVKAVDEYVPMGRHTTYMRNLDKISLHKYGDSLEWSVNTNMKGIPMLKHDANTPFGGKFERRSLDAAQKDLDVYAVFCYPSDNRPFYGRRDNLMSDGPIHNNKGFAPLKHHFLTMPPIRKGDGTALIKQRCSFIMEQSVSVTFHFPETVAEEDYSNILEQKKGVILRPAIVQINKKQIEATPTKPPPPDVAIRDTVRERLRESIRERTRVPRLVPADIENRYELPIASRVGGRQRIFALISYLVSYCDELDLAGKCKELNSVINLARGNLPVALDWNNLPMGAFPPPSLPPKGDYIDQAFVFLDKVVPKFENKYKWLAKPLLDEQIRGMIEEYDWGSRGAHLSAYLIYQFLIWCHDNNLVDVPHDNYIEPPNSAYEIKDFRNDALCAWLRPHIDEEVNAMWQNKCTDKTIRFWPPKMDLMIWDRPIEPTHTTDDWKKFTKRNMKIVTKNDGPWTFELRHFIEFCYHMNVYLLPIHSYANDFIDAYNNCVQKALDEQYPHLILTPEQIKTLEDKNLLSKIMKQQVEIIDPITNDPPFTQYETSVFFV